jgi:hypothetical protein
VTLWMGSSALPAGKQRLIVSCAAIAAESVSMCLFRTLRLRAFRTLLLLCDCRSGSGGPAPQQLDMDTAIGTAPHVHCCNRNL